MIVEIPVAADDLEHPLRQQLLDAVLDAPRIVAVHEARRKFAEQSGVLDQHAQEHQPAVRGDLPRVERGLHSA